MYDIVVEIMIRVQKILKQSKRIRQEKELKILSPSKYLFSRFSNS